MGLLLARLSRRAQRPPRGPSEPPLHQRHQGQARCGAATLPCRRMALWRGPAPDLLPPGAAAGLKSARPLCTLRSSTHGRTPQKPPRLPLSFARTAVCPHERGRQQANPRPFTSAPTSPLLLSRRRQPRGFSEPGAPGSLPPAPSDVEIIG
ncbi:hypothetical protein NDU88_002208 [Pleurodeles waltl]|uniref:Uncharacterized protein n=1 Tax=Pleurodeles waltl TaxID=8319 RepID=A0AAV7NLC6_PLEWA|nr:hypothetical protein NDU88_002208 [Pleurodeles waltl]